MSTAPRALNRGLREGLLALATLAAPQLCAQVGTTQPQLTREEQLSFRLGPLQVAPYIRLGQVFVDTNVFYTPEDRRSDLAAAGGPGLRLSLAVRAVTLYVDGNAHYYWFARTVSERQLGGQAGGGMQASFGSLKLGATRFYTRTYERPSIEVDRRVLRDQWSNRVYLDFAEEAGARFRLSPRFTTERSEVASGVAFRGADLGRTLTQDQIRAELEAKLRLTPKTDLLVVGDQAWLRFPRDATLDSDSNRVGGGFALASETRLSGRVVGGLRFFRPKHASRGGDFRGPFANGTIEWRFGRKTLLSTLYRLETDYSAFSTVTSRLPTIRTQTLDARLNRRLGLRFDLDLRGSMVLLENEVPVSVTLSDGTQSIVRNDRYYTGTVDLGWNIFSRLRLGAMASYSRRQSLFRDFGVEGLLTGASLRFNP